MKRKKQQSGLSSADPQGRLDVALYRIASQWTEQLERRAGVMGLRQHILPILEAAIVEHVPAQNLIPREITGLLKVCELNRGKR